MRSRFLTTLEMEDGEQDGSRQRSRTEKSVGCELDGRVRCGVRECVGARWLGDALSFPPEFNAFFCVPQELQKAEPLVPALQSNWLVMHVFVMILSYASLILGSLFAFTLLLVIQTKNGYG